MVRQSIAHLFRLDREAKTSLQGQLRARIVETINSGVLPPDLKLPSSRKLGEQLGLARNTVSLAYQELIASGHLASRERSGVYVARGHRPSPSTALKLVHDGSMSKPNPALLKEVMAECHKRGLIILACGMYGNVIRFLPALTISDAEIDKGLALFSEALRQAVDGQG